RRWGSYKLGEGGRDGKFDDLTVELRLEAPCNNGSIACPDPNLVVSSHATSAVDYRADLPPSLTAPLPGVPAGPVKDAAGGEGNPQPIGATVVPGGRVDTL